MSKQLKIVIGLIGALAVTAICLSLYTIGRTPTAGSRDAGRQASAPPLRGEQSARGETRSPDRMEPLPGAGQEPQVARRDQPAVSAAAPGVEEPREIARDKVRGKIVDTGWRTYVVRSQDTGKKYSFAFGRITRYNKRQKLNAGDRITVTYQYDRKRLVATYIEIH